MKGIVMCKEEADRIGRKKPMHRVHIWQGHPTIVYITVCTKDRPPWLVEPGVHALLRAVWLEADAWLMGRYVLMPDHLHGFAAYSGSDISLDNWMRYWKSKFRMADLNPERKWQPGYWDTNLRTAESYQEKWDYVRGNPVRHRLVERVEDWPSQGEIHCLPW